MVEASKKNPRRQRREYRTVAGARPVKHFFDELTDEGVGILAGIKEVAQLGLVTGACFASHSEP